MPESGHWIESYYRATAEDFLLNHEKFTTRTLRSEVGRTGNGQRVERSEEVWFSAEIRGNNVLKLADLRFGIERRGVASVRFEIEVKIWNDDELSLMERTLAIDLAGILLMTDEEFTEHQRARGQLRTLLLSLVKKNQAQAGSS